MATKHVEIHFDSGELEVARVDRRVLVGFESLQRLVSTKAGQAA